MCQLKLLYKVDSLYCYIAEYTADYFAGAKDKYTERKRIYLLAVLFFYERFVYLYILLTTTLKRYLLVFFVISYMNKTKIKLDLCVHVTRIFMYYFF